MKFYKMSGTLVAREIDFETSLSQKLVHTCYIAYGFAQNCNDIYSPL